MCLIKYYFKYFKTGWKSLIIPAFIFVPLTYVWAVFIFYDLFSYIEIPNTIFGTLIYYGLITLFISIFIFGPYNFRVSEDIQYKFNKKNFWTVFWKIQIFSYVFSFFLLIIFMVVVLSM